MLNLARDHNRRGLLSLRHQDSMVDRRTPEAPEDRALRTESQAEVIDALNTSPPVNATALSSVSTWS